MINLLELKLSDCIDTSFILADLSKFFSLIPSVIARLYLDLYAVGLGSSLPSSYMKILVGAAFFGELSPFSGSPYCVLLGGI